ncbi:MAG TPA: biotin--[acetyl-CoA-carboxylase] ligase [Steroidobacteraceae bacterium]|nr:biotin--[acetyl-CoA-carboxylase] ligase [Steroidobacteraceae bacterium]
MSERESLPQRVCRLLSDGQFHSGTALASSCGVSRNAIWKAVAGLRALGLNVHAVANRGYRIPNASDLLDPALILSSLPKEVAGRLRQGQCVWRTASTNLDLLARAPGPVGSFDYLTAECQVQGRGRRSRSWFAPPCGAICLSMSWNFAALPADASALSLAVGVCVLRALKHVGLSGLALKWPNDLVVNGEKLAGLLIELRAEAGGPAYVVVGIGLNVVLGDAVHRQIEAAGNRAADLLALGIQRADRNEIVAALIASTAAGLEQYERDGFSSFAPEWREADALAGKVVVVSSEAGSVTGHARGIDLDGALCLQTRDGLQRFVTGDVSVRAVT